MNNLPTLFNTRGKATCSSIPIALLFLTAAPWLTQGRQACCSGRTRYLWAHASSHGRWPLNVLCIVISCSNSCEAVPASLLSCTPLGKPQRPGTIS